MPDTELLPRCKTEPARRLEIFTGTGRRRAWSAAQKGQIVAESCESGETVCAVARRHGLTPQQLFAWRRAVRRRTQEAAGARGSAFAPVIVDAALRCPRLGGSAVIEIVIGAATVRIPAGADAATLQTVLGALRAAT